jgi:hypothetical protein
MLQEVQFRVAGGGLGAETPGDRPGCRGQMILPGVQQDPNHCDRGPVHRHPSRPQISEPKCYICGSEAPSRGQVRRNPGSLAPRSGSLSHRETPERQVLLLCRLVEVEKGSR